MSWGLVGWGRGGLGGKNLPENLPTTEDVDFIPFFVVKVPSLQKTVSLTASQAVKRITHSTSPSLGNSQSAEITDTAAAELIRPSGILVFNVNKN